MAKQKIRIKLKSFDHRILDQSAAQITGTAEQTGGRVAGPVPLPTRIEKFCVIRSPFIDKDSQGAVRDPDAQASDRYSGSNYQDN